MRGLDYYTRTVFEWTTDALGAQSTVCAGGRYDGLVAQLGGADTPGIGWAMGQERIVMLLEKQAQAIPATAAAHLSGAGRGARRAAGLQARRAVARCAAGFAAADELGRRQFQGAIQARRQERRGTRAGPCAKTSSPAGSPRSSGCAKSGRRKSARSRRSVNAWAVVGSVIDGGWRSTHGRRIFD